MEKDVFCKIVANELSSNTCYEDEFVKCIMDISPAAPGHTLIIPKTHYTTILDMSDEIIAKIHNAAKIMIKRMEENLPNITGIKAVVNYGDEQAVKHYHLHLLPIYGTKPTISQQDAFNLLKK